MLKFLRKLKDAGFAAFFYLINTIHRKIKTGVTQIIQPNQDQL